MKLERKKEAANPGTKVLKIMLIKAQNYEHANPYSKSRPPSTPQFPKTKTSKNMEGERGPKSTGTRNFLWLTLYLCLVMWITSYVYLSVVEDRRTSLLGGGIAGIYSVQSGYYKVYGKKFRAEIVENTEAYVGIEIESWNHDHQEWNTCYEDLDVVPYQQIKDNLARGGWSLKGDATAVEENPNQLIIFPEGVSDHWREMLPPWRRTRIN